MLVLETVSLRALKKSDSDILYDAINNPTMVRFNAPFNPVDEDAHLKWFSDTIQSQSKKFFIIEFEGIPVGSIQLMDINFIHRNAEITVRMFNEKYCGKGIGTKALALICDYAFRDIGLIRVWIRVFENNVRAIRSYEKVGFLKEGIMRKAAFIEGRFLNIIIMARLVNDDL